MYTLLISIGTGNTKMYQVRVWSNYERREKKGVNGGDHHPLFGETLTFNDNQTDVFTVTSLKLQLVKARVPQLVGVNVMPTEFEPSEQVVGVGEVTISGKSEETVVEVLVENRVVTGRVRVIFFLIKPFSLKFIINVQLQRPPRGCLTA